MHDVNGLRLATRIAIASVCALALLGGWAAGAQTEARAAAPSGDLVMVEKLGQSGFSVIPARGGKPRLVTRSGATPVWSPNGRWIAFVDSRHVPKSHPCRDDDNDIGCPNEVYVVRPDGTGERRVTPPASGTSDPVWSPDATKLVVKKSASLYVINLDGTGFRRLVKHRGGASSPSWSPDGSRIAYAGDTGAHIGSDIFITDLHGRTRQITSKAMGIGPSNAPHWSPNRRWIAFEAYKPFHTGLTDLYVISPTGKGLRRVTRTTASAYEMDWSPDSTRIVYAGGPGLFEGLLVVEVATGRSTPLTRERGTESWSGPSWSPGGRELVATWMISGNPQGVFTMASDGRAKERLVGDSVSWGWQPRPR